MASVQTWALSIHQVTDGIHSSWSLHSEGEGEDNKSEKPMVRK